MTSEIDRDMRKENEMDKIRSGDARATERIPRNA
jgi:hypothetical protein